MFRKRRKRKSKQVTLKDLKKILIKTENTDMFLLRLKQKSHMQLQKHTKTQWKRWKEVTNMIILYTLLICFIGKDSENENAI